MISFDDFKKIGLKIARIKEVKEHPNADKLYILKVDLGTEEREVVAGIKKAYSPEELQGRLVVLVDNLQPATIRGVESNGMVLATQDGDTMAILSPDKDISPGSIVK
ncbi:MAG: methionine--tRNA ligase subunit beta [Candidatus Omnitrophica bacterium]|nr:methionine--tRNA ligase subunit beta [Candidatus Omnitrophota bacterium]MBU4148721.1 methionine--tRNA ligase subunit beta [Candidatus Omnitrophota bacterium]